MVFYNPSLHQVKRGIHFSQQMFFQKKISALTKALHLSLKISLRLISYPYYKNTFPWQPMMSPHQFSRDSSHPSTGPTPIPSPSGKFLLGSHANGTDVATRGMELKTGVKKASKLEAMESETPGFP